MVGWFENCPNKAPSFINFNFCRFQCLGFFSNPYESIHLHKATKYNLIILWDCKYVCEVGRNHGRTYAKYITGNQQLELWSLAWPDFLFSGDISGNKPLSCLGHESFCLFNGFQKKVKPKKQVDGIKSKSNYAHLRLTKPLKIGHSQRNISSSNH